jgi:hypothetical protein
LGEGKSTIEAMLEGDTTDESNIEFDETTRLFAADGRRGGSAFNALIALGEVGQRQAERAFYGD